MKNFHNLEICAENTCVLLSLLVYHILHYYKTFGENSPSHILYLEKSVQVLAANLFNRQIQVNKHTEEATASKNREEHNRKSGICIPIGSILAPSNPPGQTTQEKIFTSFI